ncbi:CHAT domain-containing protein [Bradyrhizobium sp. 179]|uniref:CHAT domain-containing protein n=1 Tax=Bradyrhizobium sp. 179 TaxID=2782648 RepID=UPI001FF829E7|nr:CHAT domain-containing protein [Bradyrhizobium sp. 179]MCK1547175.1 CHAT domain-containing protein [Bradyrhizobium sp. 179]
MVTRHSIINLAGDHEETVERLSKHLGRNKLRRKLFNVIYGPGSLPRSKKQIMKAANVRGQDAQQAQNQIDHLATHHLIIREDNDGSVKDGSRNLYRKDPNVRAIRKELVKFADNPKARAKLPTKRRPATNVVVRSIKTINRRDLKKKAHLNILYLTADPDKAHALRVDAEVRRVQDAIRGSQFRDNITVQYRPAANVTTLLDGLNDFQPQMIHFSGHGSPRGLAMDNAKVGKQADEAVSFSLLAKALAATDHPPRLVLLNSCHSSGARKPLLKLGLIVISMKTSISDLGAVAFAPSFYAALAAGQSVQAAFRQGAVAVEHVSLSEADTPELFYPPGTRPADIKLA